VSAHTLNISHWGVFPLSSPCPIPQDPKDKVSMQHIVVTMGVAEATIRGVYR